MPIFCLRSLFHSLIASFHSVTHWQTTRPPSLGRSKSFS
jgi:hypothetical protein